jgi:hypothetical protein
MLTPSDIVVRPTNLTERLAAEDSAGAPLPEPTPTTMAERFAPEALKLPSEDAVRAAVDPPVIPGLIAQRGRAPSPGKWLLIAAMLVSLVPTAAILALLWKGMIAIPAPGEEKRVADREPVAASVQAAIAPAPVPAPAPAPAPVIEIAPKAEIALTAPGRIEAISGDEVDFSIAIDSSEALPARSVIAIRSVPEGATFSQGRPYGNSEWNLTPDEIGDLKLKLAETASGSADLRVELIAADGEILASAPTRLDIAPDPRTALILRSDEAGRVADLIALGHKMVDVGYFAGARAYFKRAAEAGSGDAAVLLGATFDPEFIDKVGAHGIKAEPQEAQYWYARAKQLGVQDIESKLRAIKEDLTGHEPAVEATEAIEAPAAPPPATVAPPAPQPAETTPSAAPNQATAAPAAEEEDPPPGTAETSLPPGSDEWVALVSYANVRAAPSSTADTLRVAEKGVKLRVTGRKGNWVQVADPVTSEVGWVYARYIETAQAPER